MPLARKIDPSTGLKSILETKLSGQRDTERVRIGVSAGVNKVLYYGHHYWDLMLARGVGFNLGPGENVDEIQNTSATPGKPCHTLVLLVEERSGLFNRASCRSSSIALKYVWGK